MALFILIVSNLNLALDDRHSAKASTLNILTFGYDMDEGQKVLNFLLLLIMFTAFASGFFKLFFIIYTIPFYITLNIPTFIFLFYSLK